jgi:hypothetical protein
VPDQHAARLEHARPLGNHAFIVSRVKKEPERGEEIQDGVEAAGPASWESAHIAVRVPKRAAGTPSLCELEKVLRQIQPVDVEPCLGQQVRVSALAAWYVE